MSARSEASFEDLISIRLLALTATFVALVFLSTSLFYIALLSSSGFFNLGEAFVYLAALIGGPIVGGIAGGVGAAMADAFLGYGIFAPATLVLKGLEGFTVGSLYHSSRKANITLRRVVLGIITLFILVFSFYVGSSIIVGNFAIAGIEYPLEIPGILLFFIALILCVIIWYIELFLGEKGKMALSCLIAGPIIIIGYFLWEVFVIPDVTLEGALFEIPFNIAQVIFGTLIAVPIVTYLEELGIIPEKSTSQSPKKQN